MNYIRYIKSFGICSVSIFIIIVLLNLFVDPYDLYQLINLPGINAAKPEFCKHTYMGKAYAVKRIKPRTITLGTSRTECGIDPLHPGWQYPPVYNLGLAGSNIYEAFRYYQHAYAAQPLKKVVMGLDFCMFNGANERSPNFAEERLLVDSHNQPQPRYYHDLLTSLLTMDALSDTLDTLFRQSSASNELFLSQGQRDPTYYFHRTRKAGGSRKRFIKTARGYLGSGTPLSSPHRDQRYFVDPVNGDATFNYYRSILRHAYAHDVAFIGFISPVHAWFWEVIRLNGMWPLWEMWKREIVRINEEEANAAGKSPFPLWDFSGYHAFATEAVPPLECAETMTQWYWEASHYKKELGDYVLDIILGDSQTEKTAFSNFGIALTSATIESHLCDIVNQQRSYQKLAAAEIKLLEELAREQKKPSRKK